VLSILAKQNKRSHYDEEKCWNNVEKCQEFMRSKGSIELQHLGWTRLRGIYKRDETPYNYRDTDEGTDPESCSNPF